jgi:hypothetical protein
MTTIATNHGRARQAFDIHPVSGALGAEIVGLDLGKISDETFTAL